MYGGSSDGDGHKAATQRKIPPASSVLWAPEPSSVHRNRCRTWIRSSNEYVSRLSDLRCLITLPQFYPFYNFYQYIQSFSISLKIYGGVSDMLLMIVFLAGKATVSRD
ncbi:hypothetical protein Gotri_017382 [Gossypium trilobum]|uniref:Uncharacterized protein n=1 Tax=Gossypium trilobum TaxID=34281 RepID=A0A7J9E6Z2_9ROSI|nr:hypothetical protein [Gossypium trilobum]